MGKSKSFDEKKSVIMFKSAYRPEYKQQNLTLLALPSGLEYTLEYQARYVTQELLDFASNSESPDLNAHIFLIDPNQNDHGKGLVIPLRSCTIRKLKIRGDISKKDSIFVVSFVLSDFLTLNNKLVLRENIIDLCDDNAQSIIRNGLQHLINPWYENEGSFVQWNSFTDELFENSNAMNTWQDIVKSVARLPEYQNSLILRMKLADQSATQDFDDIKEFRVEPLEQGNSGGSLGFRIGQDQKPGIYCYFYNPHVKKEFPTEAPTGLTFSTKDAIFTRGGENVAIVQRAKYGTRDLAFHMPQEQPVTISFQPSGDASKGCESAKYDFSLETLHKQTERSSSYEVVKEHVEMDFPYPIARRFRDLRSAASDEQKILCLADVFANTIQFLSMIMISDHCSTGTISEQLRNEVTKTLAQPATAGRWEKLIKAMLAAYQETSKKTVIQGLIEFLNCGGLNQIDEIRMMRNVLIKRIGLNDKSLSEFNKKLLSLLRDLEPIMRYYRLMLVNSYPESHDVFVLDVTLFAGFDDRLTHERAECSENLPTGKVLLTNIRTNEMLMLHPFYAVAKCRATSCESSHFFILDSFDATRKTGRYISLVGPEEHKYESKEFYREYQAMLRGGSAKEFNLRPNYFALHRDPCMDSRCGFRKGEMVGGKYEVVSTLRRGSLSDVYAVTEGRSEHIYALKILPYQRRRAERRILMRFETEISAMKNCEHPRIVEVYAHGEDGPDLYYVMEYASGWEASNGVTKHDLGEITMPVKEILARNICQQICEGLEYIHSKGIIHRDLKPSNVLLFRNRELKLSDFGIVKSRENLTMTEHGDMLGTPEYMAPEQAKTDKIDKRSDLYSLGVIMYQLLTGRVPLKGLTAIRTIYMLLQDPIPDPKHVNPGISESMRHLLFSLLAKDPNDRPSSAIEVYHALSQ